MNTEKFYTERYLLNTPSPGPLNFPLQINFGQHSVLKDKFISGVFSYGRDELARDYYGQLLTTEQENILLSLFDVNQTPFIDNIPATFYTINDRTGSAPGNTGLARSMFRWKPRKIAFEQSYFTVTNAIGGLGNIIVLTWLYHD